MDARARYNSCTLSTCDGKIHSVGPPRTLFPLKCFQLTNCPTNLTTQQVRDRLSMFVHMAVFSRAYTHCRINLERAIPLCHS